MPSTTSGRITKSRKKSTRHQKNHRWESFTDKISNLHSLDPLRRVRRHDLETEDFESTTSYFQSALQRWGDLNISKNFVSFKREVLSLSESLPQILHFEERIMQSLVDHISKQDKEGLEPLLDLLTAFAHDLGSRFEKYYSKSLDLIVAIAGQRQEVEVLEWTFAALAFLFKYLSKLLAPNIPPTYDVLAPLLGKARHPAHIARVAAEALSYLIKKAAAPAHREAALSAIVEHARDDLLSIAGDRQFQLYQDGLMTMFAEAIKAPGQTIHSTGPAILQALIEAIPAAELTLSQTTIWTDLICGVLTSVIHHSNSSTLSDLVNAIQEQAQTTLAKNATGLAWRFVPLIRIFGTLAGVRSGSRVNNWDLLIRNLVAMLDLTAKEAPASSVEQSGLVWKHVIINIVIAWHQAPMDALIPSIQTLTKALKREQFMRWYIPFCAYFSELDPVRFRNLFQTDFLRFIKSHWSEANNEDILCILLPRMVKSHSLPAADDNESRDLRQLPQGWQSQIVTNFELLEASPFPERGAYNKDPQTWRDRCLPKYSALLELMDIMSVHASTNARIAELLLRKLKLALRPSSSLASDEVRFSISQGFQAYLRMTKAAGSVDPGLYPLLRAALPRFSRSAAFLEGYLAYEETTRNTPGMLRKNSDSSENSATESDPLVEALIKNLTLPSAELRMASLKVLAHLDETPDELSCLAIMIQIQETSLGLDNIRAIAMHLRKLGQNYSLLKEKSWLLRAIPSFMFGMLTVRVSPIWKDALEALKPVGESAKGEEAICDLAFEWLDVPSARGAGPMKQLLGGNTYTAATDFDCTNLQRLWSTATNVEKVIEHATDLMLESFDDNQQAISLHVVNARSQALKVFSSLPSLAEKRSRKLVPAFLSWAGETSDQDDSQEDEQDHPVGKAWSLEDRKALIGIFAQFLNPRVLYQHERVYQALLHLMGNGDDEVQKLTLKAILKWKQEGVKPYQESLEYLLDPARLKNELTVLMQGEQAIQPEHRSELMPILLRLLYGRAISKRGVSSGRHGLQATRFAILRNLSVEDLGSFLDIAVGDLRGVRVVDESGLRSSVFDQELLPARNQVGFLNMMLSLINELGSNVMPYVDTILNSVLYCLIFACRRLGESAAEADAEPEDGSPASQESLYKASRSIGLKCLISLFRNAQGFNWSPYSEAIVGEVVTPRIGNLPIETAQGISGLLQLLSTWSQLPRAALFLSINEQTLPKIIECVSVEKAKDDVKIFALTIVQNLVNLAEAPATESEFNELIKAELLDRNIEIILTNITSALHIHNIGNDLLNACVETIVALSPLVETSENVQGILNISIFLLKQQPKKVSPKTKGKILLILERFIRLHEPVGSAPDGSIDLNTNIFETLSGLFSYFKDRQNREALSRVLLVLASKDSELEEVASLCEALNSFAERRMDEPDYDKRLAAFNQISNKETPFTARQWLPLLHNMIFYIRHDEEFGVLASNSADILRKFIQEAATCEDETSKNAFDIELKDILLPALYLGVRELSATVRRETLRVFGYLLARMSSWAPMADMQGLLRDTDAEAAEPPFFFNILSPATSRQLEALQLLEAANEAAEFSSQNLSQFFIPLLEHFIFGREDGTDDHGLGAQATNTIGALALSLDWKHYRTILQRYISYVESKPDLQKQVIRLLGKVADALTLASQQKSAEPIEMDSTDGIITTTALKRLATTIPSQEKLGTDAVNYFLPSLLKHLHEKDESEVSYRVPVGVIIVKLLKLLDTEQMNQKLAGVLTDICHILRSKSWEAREMARDTLVKISSILGATHFGFILKELRSALRRGYQLHVLSYTVHSMLLAVIPEFQQGDLDYCLPLIVAIIIDDIFGATGQEKDAEGYTAQMKEIKSSKSQDSMELIAKTASINHLIDLTRPLQSLLLQKVDLKMVRKIDALLMRITSGLLQNPASESRDTLVFCYEVVQEVYKSRIAQVEPKIDPRVKRYLVQKGAKKTDRGTTSKHTYKLIKFAFDVLRSVLKKHDSLRNATNIAGFVPILGDAVVAGEDDVKVAAFKLLTVLVKVPFKTTDGNDLYKVSIKEATKSLSTSTSTTSDLSQSALKLISVVLKERRDVPIKDAAIDILLGKLKDDLTEPLYRHVTFSFVRSVLDRKIETATVYDILDYVGTVMITNDDKDTRDLARGAFFQFLRDYPQKKARWAKQLNFVVANLKYDREGGRLSVMEIVHLLLMKSADDFVQEVIGTCFLPLIFVLANDDSEKCRLASGELIKEIFRKANKERMQKFTSLLRSWVEQDDNPAVLKLALQTFGYYFEAQESSMKQKKELQLVLDKISEILGTGDIRVSDEDMVATSLRVLQILAQNYPSKLLSTECQDLWSDIRGCLIHPEGSVKLIAVKLVSTYLADFAGSKSTPGQSMKGSHGIELTSEDIEDIVRLGLGTLRVRAIKEELASELAQIIIFLGPHLAVTAHEEDPIVETLEDDDGAEEEEEDSKFETRPKDLQYLFWKLSAILRKEIPPKSTAIIPKVAAMEVMETICRRVPQANLNASLKTILFPLHNLTDPSIPVPYSTDEIFKTKHEAMRTRAQILMESLQKKFGTAEYTKQLLAIRDEVRNKRQQRSSKRKIGAIVQPEKHGKDKRKKFEKKKERRKVKGQEHKAIRQAYKGW